MGLPSPYPHSLKRAARTPIPPLHPAHSPGSWGCMRAIACPVSIACPRGPVHDADAGTDWLSRKLGTQRGGPATRRP